MRGGDNVYSMILSIDENDPPTELAWLAFSVAANGHSPVFAGINWIGPGVGLGDSFSPADE